jgi:ribokinase
MTALKKIAVIGSLNLDILAHVGHVPVAGETVLAKYGGRFQGGKGANQAGAVAKLGGGAVMLGAVGSDAAGEFLLQNLIKSGVKTEYVKAVSDEPTGQAWIILNKEGNNSIIVLPGANSLVDIPYIEAVRPVIQSADIVLMQMEIPLESVCYAASMAKALGKTVILDPAPAVSDLPDSLLACTDYIKPNESELQILTGRPAGRYRDGARQLAERGARNVIVSLGERGVYCLTEDGSAFERPARKVNAIDTTAAGDAFIAAFALCLARGGGIDEAVDFAQIVASVTVTRPGAQNSIPSTAELGAWL